MDIYILMSGTDNSGGLALRIAKSSDEVLSLIAKHALTLDFEKSSQKKQGSLLALTDLLINNTQYITEDSLAPIVKAMADKDEDVAITADVCVITVSTESSDTVFSTLLKETKKAKGDAKERMKSTVTSLYALAREAEKARLAKLASRYGFGLGDNKVVPIRPKKPIVPAKPVEKMRRAA